MRLKKENLMVLAGVGLGSMLVLMIIGSFLTRLTQAQAAPKDAKEVFVDDYCFGGAIGRKEMDSIDVVKAYTKATNEWFNANLKIIMTKLTEDFPSPSLDDYGKGSGAVKLCGDKADVSCKALSVCLSNGGNPSPYCVGAIALGMTQEKFANYDFSALQFDPGLKIAPNSDNQSINPLLEMRYSYFCYKAALEKFKDDFADGTPFGILQKCDKAVFAQEEICQTRKEWQQETNSQKKQILESKIVSQFNGGATVGSSFAHLPGEIIAGLAGTIGIKDAATANATKINFINTEITRSKEALDQTLDAYSQLRTAWKMHINYVDLFAELVKYRDSMVEVRKQTDTFPGKFIDATTTHCL